jgi:amino acid adenylation domain-containing protein
MDDLANHAYMESLVLRGRGRLDAEILQRAFQAVVDRHESLRTSFSDDGRRQMIHRTVTVDFRSVDGSGLLGSDLDRARETFMEELTGRAFDLRVAPLVRLGVFRLTADSQLIVISGHHIVFDGWSLNLFINDLAHCYTAQLGQIPTPEPPAAQFRDYAAWLEQKLQDPEMEVYEAFWRELLAGSLPDLNLPHDLPKPVRWSWRGARVSTRLSQSLRDRLAAVGRTYQATLFMTLLAAWQTFLHRFSGERDLVIGCPVLGRSMPQGMAIVGYLTHLLPIRTQLLPGESFAAFLERSRGLCLDAFENQDYPFSHMIRLFEGPSNPGEPALIRATFNLDRPREGPRFGGLQCEILTPEIRAAKFELSLNVMDLGGELLLEFDYNRDLFSAELAAVIRESFVAWLRQIAEEPARPQASLRLETEPVRTSPPARVLPAISAPTVDAAFAQRAAESPEAICLIAARASEPAGGARRLTYAELHMRASQVTARLHAAGVGLEDIVGLATNRGECRVIGLLGILQAGAAAFPLEASYPEARLRFMLEDCGASVVVCDPANEEHFAHLGYRTVVIGSEANQFPPSAATHHSADHLACIVYTSGSTGTPKGVAMTHANILSLLNAMAQRRDNPRGAVLHHSAFSFDAAIWEIWWPLLFGEPLVIAPPGELALGELAQCLREYQVRDAFFTTGLFNRLVDFEGETLAGLERIIVGGSTASARHFDALLQRNPKLCLLNVYGPTECTTFSTFHACSPVDASRGRIPIGTPLAGFRAEVLDPFFQPVPLHVPGELYLGGTSVARGYVNRPALTAERFLPDPAASEAGARLYRTGDRVRRLADGTLEFLGRFDHQVKVNGFRIELSEIEAALQDHPEIAQCLASVYEAGPGDHRLAVHIVAKGAAPDGGKVRKFLAARLPAYMVPMHVVVLPTLPLDANGKPDRRTLAVPELAASPSDAGAQSPPETPTEKQLAILWRRLLKREAIYRETDFFAAGGHSLLLAELVAEVAKELAVPVSLRDVYEHPTLAGCAQLLDSRREEGTLATAIPRVSRSARRGSRRSESRQPGLSEEP